ncbi:MAG: 4Fe-4S binding protein [Deltaproteobacteria bacterium]|nr:4Fe-4S binding protein [Deltaproteobacteria bacterium]
MRARILSHPQFQGICQLAALFFINGHFHVFKTGTIYQGRLKSFCIPVLNCYSCPMALYACPLGSLQFFVMTGRVPLYVLSLLLLVGMSAGRMTCGLLCPFGYVQDLLFKLGSVRVELPQRLTYIKYAILFLVVFGLSAWFGLPAFCKVCPLAVLEAGIPLVLMDSDVYQRLFEYESGNFTGWLFVFKIVVLLGIIILTFNIKRPFCRVLCPLGAFFGLCNRHSITCLRVDQELCNNCQLCARKCPVDLNISENPESAECLRCMRCTFCDAVTADTRLLTFSLQNPCKKQSKPII